MQDRTAKLFAGRPMPDLQVPPGPVTEQRKRNEGKAQSSDHVVQ